MQDLPEDEDARLRLLRALDLLDSPPEPVFDRITRLVARSLGVPIALVSLIDAQRQWFKSRYGLALSETPREYSFCARTIMQREPLVIADASTDERFEDNPLVTGGPRIRFYAGVAVRSAQGVALGSLCAIDDRPRELDDDDLRTLTDLAEIVSREMQMREALLLGRQAPPT